jgi:hypothetical protein
MFMTFLQTSNCRAIAGAFRPLVPAYPGLQVFKKGNGLI